MEHVRTLSSFVRAAPPGFIFPRSAPNLRDPVGRPRDVEARQPVWTTTYWPMSGFARNGEVPRGNPSENLWAEDGPLAKLDRVQAARGLPSGAQAHEHTPYFNWLVDKPSGYYIPAAVVSERNFEQTSGVDVDGDGVLRPNVGFDFIDSNGNLRKDGRLDGELNVAWFGSCDKVAIAGMRFREPKQSVTLEGVIFTAQDIKGLLAVVAEPEGSMTEFVGHRFRGLRDEVVTKDGRSVLGELVDYDERDMRSNPATFHYEGDVIVVRGVERDLTMLDEGLRRLVFPAADVETVRHETKAEPSAQDFHEIMKAWLGEGRAFAMDTDPDVPVWNYAFDGVHLDVRPMKTTESLIGHDGPAGKGQIYKVRASLRGARFGVLDYWLEVKDRTIVNSGWISEGVDFLWRLRESPPLEGSAPRNPLVSLDVVQTLYERSTR